ncbi:helix-turn-helix domain-containing protein [Mycobacterium sp. NPDC050441]|uniref:TetR/AcrR family transcriptional regulator n=1 Tax=Mycobacterium sp. NPDC050441 TaxID=3155403 RepID=UPI00340E7D96
MSGPLREATPETAAAVLRLLAGEPPAALPRHRHDLSRDDVREAQRVRIMAAAIELFADPGYPVTTVLDITKRAGVSRKTFYQLYDTKEDVFLDAYCAVGVLVSQAGLASADPQEPFVPAEIPRYAGQVLALIAATPASTRMFFLEALGAGPRVRARRNEAIAEFVAALSPRLKQLRAQAEPDLRELSDQQCRIVVAAGIELIAEYLADHDPTELPAITNDLTELVRSIVTPNHPTYVR